MKIERLVVFPIIKRGDWQFRMSVTDKKNIMLIAVGGTEMLVRFYTDPELAELWVLSLMA